MIVGGYTFKQKHRVIKKQDINKYLTNKQRQQLIKLLANISEGRLKCGKKMYHRYLVCNIDEEYAGQVAEIIGKNEGLDKIKGGKKNERRKENS